MRCPRQSPRAQPATHACHAFTPMCTTTSLNQSHLCAINSNTSPNMSNQRDHNGKNQKSDRALKHLPTEVILKARTTLGTLLKPKHQNHDRPKFSRHSSRDKSRAKEERLKVSRSEPEFSNMALTPAGRQRRSRIDECGAPAASPQPHRPRPLSLGPDKRLLAEQVEDFHRRTFPLEPVNVYSSAEDVCVLTHEIVVNSVKSNGGEIQAHENVEKPRKKLSFREPEILDRSEEHEQTPARTHKLMGINSLTRRPQRISLQVEPVETVITEDSDLESQAMRIVRTVGQAFEVCHNMQRQEREAAEAAASQASTSSVAGDPAPSITASEVLPFKESGASSLAQAEAATAETKPKMPVFELLPPPARKTNPRRPAQSTVPPVSVCLPECVTKVEVCTDTGDASTPLTAQHQLQLLRERLDQQAQQTRVAVAQLILLRDQLAAEQAARCEAQARTHQLLVHNKELLEHISALVVHLQERERDTTRLVNAHQLTLLPQAGAGAASRKATNVNKSQGQQSSLAGLLARTSAVLESNQNNNVAEPFPALHRMTNQQIHNYFITRFEIDDTPAADKEQVDESKKYNQEYFQNSSAFPNIPPVVNDSKADIDHILSQYFNDEASPIDGSDVEGLAAGVSHMAMDESSSSSSSPEETSVASSEEADLFIKPLSNNGTLASKSSDGRVKLIVAVSPSSSSAHVPPSSSACTTTEGSSLQVPGRAAPITRSTSEKVPSRSDMMNALRAQWTRHTTK